MFSIDKIAILLFLFMFFGGHCYSHYSYTIAIGEEDYPPYEMTIDGKLTGFHLELLKILEKKYCVDIKIIRLPFERATSALKKGDIDGFTYFGMNKERQKYAYFLPNFFLHNEEIVLVSNKQNLFKYNNQLTSLYPMNIYGQIGFKYGLRNEDYKKIVKNTFRDLPLLVKNLEMKRASYIIVYKDHFHNTFDDLFF